MLGFGSVRLLSALVLALLLRSASWGEVIPFGCPLDEGDCSGPSSPCSDIPPLSAWPGDQASRPADPPLAFDKRKTPYRNERGRAWVARINAWYEEGTAAGLWQDTFRSFDDGHSSLRQVYPQLTFLEAIRTYHDPCGGIFGPRVTVGVQSLGVRDGGTWAVADYAARSAIRAAHETGSVNPVQSQSFYRLLYERNFLLVAPAVGSFADTADRFRFLSPFYLHSVGRSGTDARLLKPLVFAAAALPPDLKTRMLRQGLYVPTLLWLFKGQFGSGIRDESAHRPAYSLPAEAWSDSVDQSPFLDGLVETARSLRHIPPVARTVIDARLTRADYEHPPYAEITPYGFFGALRRGETVELTVDLRRSWVDKGQSIREYFAELLRGPGSIGFLNPEHSLLRFRIPWTSTTDPAGIRTDVLLLVNDGVHDSAPAYVSVRHLQDSEKEMIGSGITAGRDTLGFQRGRNGYSVTGVSAR